MTDRKHFDVAIIGQGIAGWSAVPPLVAHNKTVVTFDLGAPPHDLGSTHGQTRFVRAANFEGSSYSKLASRSIHLLEDLNAHCDNKAFIGKGAIYCGPADRGFIPKTLQVAKDGGIRLVAQSAAPVGLAIPAEWAVLKDEAAGYANIENVFNALARAAEPRFEGQVERLTHIRCKGWRHEGGSVVIETSAGDYTAGKVIVTTGAWIGELVPALKPFSAIQRQVLHWFADPEEKFGSKNNFLPFIVATLDGRILYGFPTDEDGAFKGKFKVAEHVIKKGDWVEAPEVLDRDIHLSDKERIFSLVSVFLPSLRREDLIDSVACMYPIVSETLGESADDSDSHFVLGEHPTEPNIIIGAGLSGHGFKFGPAIGEVLASLAMGRKPDLDIEFFSPARLVAKDVSE